MKKNQSGTILIEAMIAILVTAFTMLGTAALQAKTLKSTQLSNLRSIASIQSLDFVERMWGSSCSLPAGSATVFSEWESNWKNDARFPGWTAVLNDSVPSVYVLTISWTNTRVNDSQAEALQSFNYAFSIPQTLSC